MSKKFLSALLIGGILITSVPVEAENRVEVAGKNYAQLFRNDSIVDAKSDPELAEIMKRFIYGEIDLTSNLTLQQKQLVTIVVLATNQNHKLLKKNIEGSLNAGITPLEIRESLYHIAPYIGFGKVFEALDVANEVFKKRGIKLPLPNQGAVTEENRLEKGLEIQVGTFGDRITKMRETAPEDEKFVQDGLSDYCFGDIYTRGTLDLKMRELLTMSALATLGVEPQLKGHIAGNLTVGNDRKTILSAIAQALPYIGFPRTLNAIRCVNEVTNTKKLAKVKYKLTSKNLVEHFFLSASRIQKMIRILQEKVMSHGFQTKFRWEM